MTDNIADNFENIEKFKDETLLTKGKMSYDTQVGGITTRYEDTGCLNL